MTFLYLRRNQSEPLSCEMLDHNFEAVVNRNLHQGTQLSSTISDLYSTVENYDFITSLQSCCTSLSNQITSLQESMFGEGEFATLFSNLRTDILLEIAALQTDLDSLDVRVTTNENNIASINSSLFSISNSIVGLQNSKANINNPIFTGVPKAPTPLSTAEPTQIATVGYVTDYANSTFSYTNSTIIPVGCILPYGGNGDPNEFFMIADGRAISRITYSTLFSIFNTIYGSGDGSSTFNLPNLQQRVPVGVGLGYSLGSTGGSSTHTLTESELPAHSHYMQHTHTINDPGHIHSLPGYLFDLNANEGRDDNDGSAYQNLGNNTNTSSTGITVNSFTGYTSQTGGWGSHNNMQPYIVLNYIVKIK